MNRSPLSAQQTPPPSPDLWSHKVLGDHNFWAARGLLAWWYRATALADAPAGTSFELRDRVRRSRIASAVMLFLGVALLFVGIIGYLGPNKQIIITTLLVWGVIVGCIFLNRAGHVNLVGILIGISVDFGMYLSILRAPGGLGPDEKDILYLLMFAELFIGAILPSGWVFVAGLINLAFSLFVLTWFPRTPALDALLGTSYAIILLRVFQTHLLPGGVLWILGTHAAEATRRADRAESVARLEHDLVAMKEAQAAEQKRLQATIQATIQVLDQVAQGQLQARVPSMPQGTFWPLIGKLNNHLARYQRACQAERQYIELQPQLQRLSAIEPMLQRLEHEKPLLEAALQQALHEQRPFQLPDQVSLLVPLVRPLVGKCIVAPSPSKEHTTHFF